ncbi:MAG: aspartate aminotransferase family protein [Fimbriimonadaceae bacterium]|nr:aspartate aminotransferase family protein [Fimbriimonadaceae bacterium]
MDADALQAHVVGQYSDHINPYLARMMNFAGFTVESSAEGCELVDHEGRRYLDFLGGYGVFSLGHRHPKVVEAVKKQLDLMPLSSKVFFNPVQAELAEELAKRAPGGLAFTFFSNSGAEAVEAALKFARVATGRTKTVSTVGSYHGKTMGALAVTGRDKARLPFEPLVPSTTFVPYGDASAAETAVDGETAAMIIEPVQGEGGIHVPPPGYLARLREICDRHGALLIVDEVQTGLGRTGRLFASEHDGVEGDIMTLAKCLGGGVMPIGATMCTQAVLEKVYGANPLLHTSTFGGNPLACSAGLAALRVIDEEGLVEQSRTNGSHLKSRLQEVQARQSLLKEVRGLGLMVGVEFTMDEVGELAIAQMSKRGLVAAYTLNNPRVIRFEPPLNVSVEQIDRAVKIFDEAVAETAEILAALA